MFRIITLDGHVAGVTQEIARHLCDRLGWRLCDRELVLEIACRAGLDIETAARYSESCDSLMRRLTLGFSFGCPEHPLCPSRQIVPDSRSLHSVIGGVMNDVARQGNCVIVGRGGCEYLRSRQDALHVFLSSGLSSRMRRMQALTGCSAAEAKRSIHRAEAERSAFFRSAFGLQWPQYDSYDMVVNERIAESAIVDLISRFVWTEELGRRSVRE